MSYAYKFTSISLHGCCKCIDERLNELTQNTLYALPKVTCIIYYTHVFAFLYFFLIKI